MLEAWAAPFSLRFQGHPGVALFELGIVEGWVSSCPAQGLGADMSRLASAVCCQRSLECGGPHPLAAGMLPAHASQVMRMWPFRQAILRSGAKSGSAQYALPCTHLYHFGANERLRGALNLTNLLTG